MPTTESDSQPTPGNEERSFAGSPRVRATDRAATVIVSAGGLSVIAAVLGQHREVEQRADRRRGLLAAPLVERDRLVLFPDQVELIRELEERVRILGIGGHGLAERRDRRVPVVGRRWRSFRARLSTLSV